MADTTDANCWEQERYRCGDEEEFSIVTASTDTVRLEQSLEHSYLIDLGFEQLYSIKSSRSLNITGSMSSSKDLYWVEVVSCEGLATPPCTAWCYTSNGSGHSSLHEVCSIQKDTIFYLDQQKRILLYRRETEFLDFATSSSETTDFRGKWGMSSHHKLKIKNAKIFGTEEFYLIFGGVKRLLNSIVYEKEPVWMMGPIGIPTTGNGVIYPDPIKCQAYDHSIQQIIVWPLPISKAIPWDEEIRCLGFYDYGYEQPGVVPQLVKDDGGKDFFWPSWIRESMVEDPFWKDVRDDRYDIVWNHNPPAGQGGLSRPDIVFDPVPKGNAVYHATVGKMFSFAFQDRNGIAHAVAELNGVDPRTAIINLGVSGYTNDWLYHPISVL